MASQSWIRSSGRPGMRSTCVGFLEAALFFFPEAESSSWSFRRFTDSLKSLHISFVLWSVVEVPDQNWANGKTLAMSGFGSEKVPYTIHITEVSEMCRHNHIFLQTISDDQGCLWWMCGCRSKCLPETDNSLTSSGMLFRVSSFVLNWCNVFFVSATFSKGGCNPYVFRTFWIYRDTGRVSSRRWVHWPNCYFHFRGSNTIKSGRNFGFCFRLCQQYYSFPCQSFHWNISPRFWQSPCFQ